MEQAAAVAVPAYPVAHVQPVTEKPITFLLVSTLFAPLYPADNDDEGGEFSRVIKFEVYQKMGDAVVKSRIKRVERGGVLLRGASGFFERGREDVVNESAE